MSTPARDLWRRRSGQRVVPTCDHGAVNLTVKTLIEDPLIRTRLVAGHAGCDRTVTWAHTCEVADPWNWLGHGDLLMSDGYSFPSDPEGQVSFIEHLSQASIAGLALGEGFVAPPLTPEATAAADRLGFPILMTARNVPFVTIARVVGDASSGRGNDRAARVLRLYEVLRRSQGHHTRDDLLEQLGMELSARLHVIDLVGGRDLLHTPDLLPEAVRTEALSRVLEQSGRLSAFNRIKDTDGSAFLVPVGTRDAAALLVRPISASDAPDLVLAQHAAMIVELEVERREVLATRARDHGTVIVRRLLEGSIAPDLAVEQLQAHDLGTGPWRVTVWQEPRRDIAAGDASLSPLEDALAFVSWPHLHAYIDDTHLVVVEDARYESGLGLDHIAATIGASRPLTSVVRFADSVREARWALESAQAAGARTAVYGSHGSYFMPNTIAEGEVAVRRLLGPILDYDEMHDAELMKSLEVYFEANRSWQAGARKLNIHKQTLVYRIKKIEELTGADLRDFGVQAELYLALRTWRLLGSG